MRLAALTTQPVFLGPTTIKNIYIFFVGANVFSAAWFVFLLGMTGSPSCRDLACLLSIIFAAELSMFPPETRAHT